MRTNDALVVVPAIVLLATGHTWAQVLAVALLAAQAIPWARRGLRAHERRNWAA